MSDHFFKFPSTPYLALLGDADIRNDKVMTAAERNEFLSHELVVEEKIDGANLGISFDPDGNIRAQNRGMYLDLPRPGQWKKLSEWLTLRTETFFEHLFDRYILFGEWCYARHTVFYDRLPDWFLGFDVYDRETDRFLSYDRRNELFRTIRICPVPTVRRGRFTLSELSELLLQSMLGEHPAEGIYLRSDRGGWLVQRAKLVRPAFVQSIEQHWSRKDIEPNRLNWEVRMWVHPG